MDNQTKKEEEIFERKVSIVKYIFLAISIGLYSIGCYEISVGIFFLYLFCTDYAFQPIFYRKN